MDLTKHVSGFRSYLGPWDQNVRSSCLRALLGKSGTGCSTCRFCCPRCKKSVRDAKFFAFRVAKPECRTTIFTGRPAVFASRVAKPECRTTIFTGRPAVFASRVAKPECRTTIFTSRPAVFASRAAKPECRTTICVETPFSPVGRQFLHLG